tara:strand:- start:477 stop:1070 length:594 start_codon:yes stop_codon:yes gene_type:complete
MDTNDIKHLAVERIFLIPDSSEGVRGYVWCDDPAPGIGMDPSEAVEYVRKDVHEAIIAKQAKAAISGMDAAKAVASSNMEHAKRLHAECNPQTLDSERSANALLTERIAELEEREALKQAEALDRLGQLLQETHFDKAPSVSRVVMQVNDAINRVKQEVRPLRLVASADSDPHPNCELECGAYGTYCKCNAEEVRDV